MADFCVYDFITYGDYTFNAFVKTNASIQPVLSDDGYTVKYDRVTFQCEFIINHETVRDTGPIGDGVDFEMDNIRRTLTTSGLTLKVSYRGLGSHTLPELGGTGIDVLKEEDVSVSSLVEGPFPELLDWEPIVGNKAVRCMWKVSYVKQRCEGHYGKQAVSNPALKIRDLLQSFIEEQELSFNESGAVTVTLTGFIEFAGLQNRNKSTSETAYYEPTTRESLKQLVKFFDTTVPLGFQRKSKFKFLKDTRTVTYTVIDTEIESDNPLFPYIVKADVTHEVSSSLMSNDVLSAGGFLKWMNSFDGTFHVRPGVWKGWAWIAFSVYLFNRRSRASDQLAKNPIEQAKNEVDAAMQADSSDNRKKSPPKQLPVSIRIKEHLLSRQVDISMRYLVTCSIAQLFEATGLFYPIDTLWTKKKVSTQDGSGTITESLQDTTYPDDIGTTPITPLPGISGKSGDPRTRQVQWELFRQYSQDLQNIYGYRGLQLPNSTLIYDPCETYGQSFAQQRGKFSEGQTSFKGHTVPAPSEPYRPEGNVVSLTNGTSYTIPGNASTGSSASTSDDVASSNYKRSEYMRSLRPKDSWVTWNDSIVLSENTNATMLPSIEPMGNNHLRATTYYQGNNVTKDKKGFTINGRNTDIQSSKYDNHKALAFGVPTYTIRATGYALRAGYSIQCPVVRGVYINPNSSNVADLEAVGNILPATRVGVNKWVHKQVAQSVDIPIYMAMWDVTYVLQGDPTRANIVYSTNSAAEYV